MTNSDPRLSAANVELKPCPFCGNAQRIREPFGIVRSGYQIACSSDECFGPHTTAHDLEDCIRQWNTRLSGVPAQPAAVSPGVIERMVTDAMEASRREAIEECARVADVNYGLMYTALRNKEVAKAVADQIARGIRNLASQPPAAPCNAAGNRYPSDEEAGRAINGAHDFAEGLRSKAAVGETALAVNGPGVAERIGLELDQSCSAETVEANFNNERRSADARMRAAIDCIAKFATSAEMRAAVESESAQSAGATQWHATAELADFRSHYDECVAIAREVKESSK